MTKAFVNGRLVDEAEATVPVSDRGFRFGDGVFETIPVHEGIPYLWEYHLERLDGGLEALHIHAQTKGLVAQAQELLLKNSVSEGLLRIQISRGSGSRGYLPDAATPMIVMQTQARPKAAGAPLTLWLSSYEKISGKALPVQFKLAQGLSSTLARMQADENGCDEALQLTADGHISEASSANIFWRKGNDVFTPSLETGALAGITRRRISEIAPWQVHEGLYTLNDLAISDAVVLTNAATQCRPVLSLTGGACRWNSSAFAAELNILLHADIQQYIRHSRELLASK